MKDYDLIVFGYAGRNGASGHQGLGAFHFDFASSKTKAHQFTPLLKYMSYLSFSRFQPFEIRNRIRRRTYRSLILYTNEH